MAKKFSWVKRRKRLNGKNGIGKVSTSIKKNIKLGLKHLVVCKHHQRLRQKSFLSICGVIATEILKDLFLYIIERLHKDCIEEKSKVFCSYGEFSKRKNKSFNKKWEETWGSLPVSLVRLEIFCSTFYIDNFFFKGLSVQNIRSPELAIVSTVSLNQSEAEAVNCHTVLLYYVFTVDCHVCWAVSKHWRRMEPHLKISYSERRWQRLREQQYAI